jgi:transposase InsO family protein
VDFINRWSGKTGITGACFLLGIGLANSKWHAWKLRYGKANEHNAWIPRDHGLDDAEKQALIDFHGQYPLEGYRRLTFLMLDRDVGACSPSSVYRVLSGAGLLDRHAPKPSAKGKGFVQPLRPHEHGHVDVSYINLAGTFDYLCSLLDGCSRFTVHGELRESMTEADVAQIVQRAREPFPGVTPRIISDNGPQFIARDFQEFIRLCGRTPVKTSPYYPQSNGKIERWHRILKEECIRPGTPLTRDDARRIVAQFVAYSNTGRLHSAIGDLTPKDKLDGREQASFAARDRKLEAARQRRKVQRQAARQAALDGQPGNAPTSPESIEVPKPSLTPRRQSSCSR